MRYFYYYIVFPNGDKQPIDHSLNVGDMVDINGNIFEQTTLNPKQITYLVNGKKEKIHFKETHIYYKLDLMKAVEVNDEIFFHDYLKNKDLMEAKLKKVFDKMEKKFKKK